VAKVVDLERQRVEALAHELVPALRERGQALVRAGEVEDLERWRRGARRAARLLGESIRTGRTRDGGAWAVLDRPATGLEHERAARAAARLLHPPGRT
jgi:hypothetical protein